MQQTSGMRDATVTQYSGEPGRIVKWGSLEDPLKKAMREARRKAGIVDDTPWPSYGYYYADDGTPIDVAQRLHNP